ncbi:hypothetical protein MACK_003948 [Theileria orientalis]|uniref:Uncharacterized protein n=1 Tax=Theileria orientalis TaxID=68886 RepID=A0A976XJN1_THEOR|nr:hypothetical protein MACK_003948 [Theileria orientalis]
MASFKAFNIIILVYILCSLALSAWISVDLYYSINPSNKKTERDEYGRGKSEGDKLQDSDPLNSPGKNEGIFTELHRGAGEKKLSDHQPSPENLKIINKPQHKKVDEDTIDGIFTELYSGLSNKTKSTKPKPHEHTKRQEHSTPRIFDHDFEEVKPEDENYGIMSEISGHPTKTKLPREKIARLSKKFVLKRLERDVDFVDSKDENYGIMSEAHGFHNRTKMSKDEDLNDKDQTSKTVHQETLVPKKVHEGLPKPPKADVEDDPDHLKKTVKEEKRKEKVTNADGEGGFEDLEDFFE